MSVVTDTQKEKQPPTVAAIELGSTALRMTVAEIEGENAVRVLDCLDKASALGRDVFTSSKISASATREAIKILLGFQQVYREYGIEDASSIRAVARSFIREAENRDAFLDRVYVGTGINFRVIDEAEESRLLFTALYKVLEADEELRRGPTLVVDLGGGSTEVLLIQDGHVTFSNFYRLGSLRMRMSLELHRTPTARAATILGQQIQRISKQIVRNVPLDSVAKFVATGHDLQLAAARLCPDTENQALVAVPYKSLQTFSEKVLQQPAERLVAQHDIPYPEAETLGPASLATLHLAKAYKCDTIYVARVNLRDGLLHEFASRGYWAPAFAQEVLNAALALITKYRAERAHAEHVAELALNLFDALRPLHGLSDRQRFLLHTAALLHEIGGYVSSRSHHKHSMYLILNSDLFGLPPEDLMLVALTARYHRRAMPKPSHPEFMALSREERIAVAKMAALLRVADALDRNHTQQVRHIRVVQEPDRVLIRAPGADDLTVERLALKEKADLFEQVFGLTVELVEEPLPQNSIV